MHPCRLQVLRKNLCLKIINYGPKVANTLWKLYIFKKPEVVLYNIIRLV